jgi:hypothetical protein
MYLASRQQSGCFFILRLRAKGEKEIKERSRRENMSLRSGETLFAPSREIFSFAF